VPLPAINAAAALTGALAWTAPSLPAAPTGATPRAATNPVLIPVMVTGLALWALPLVVAWAAGSALLTDLGLFFSKLAIVTFGGAYAVLSYMTQEIVQDYGWVTTGAMMDALGLAETTPGPLILVTAFVGYLAGAAQGGADLGLAAWAMTLWVTFLPSFLWIFAFAPYVEWIATRPRLAAALQGVTAAVVGVIANLALWFALHVFFGAQGVVEAGPFRPLLPDWTTLDPRAVVIAAAAGVALLWRHANLFAVLGVSALAGWALSVV
jgi:chromate transporter